MWGSVGAPEELNNDLFKNTLGPVKQVLEDSGLKKNQVDEIVLVGGSTRIPKVQQLIKAPRGSGAWGPSASIAAGLIGVPARIRPIRTSSMARSPTAVSTQMRPWRTAPLCRLASSAAREARTCFCWRLGRKPATCSKHLRV
jgi:hypothetical protein